jgi:protein gp37
MGANSAIEWCHATFNPWRGCSKVHEGCAHCYAESNYSVRMHGVKWGPNGTRVRLSDAGWREPLKWNREAEAAGERKRVFCASLADVFEDWQGPILDHHGLKMGLVDDGGKDGLVRFDRFLTMDDLRRDLFELIHKTPWLDWLLLTKRPENVRAMWPAVGFPNAGVAGTLGRSLYLQNVWLGTSVSNQETAERMVPLLLNSRDLCRVLFLSCEPLLGPIDLRQCRTHEGDRNALFVGPEGGYEYAGIASQFHWLGNRRR